MKLKDKVALITGSSKGIGRAIVLLFAKEGACTIINYLTEEEKADKITKEIQNSGGNAFAIKADISKVNEISEMINEIIKRFGRIDILVNNAAIYKRNNFSQATENTWDPAINTNLKGAFFCSKFVADYMIKQKFGKIINISSNAGIKPKKEIGLEYGVSKAGLIYLTKSLALTLAPYNINVNCIAPGYTDTDMANLNKDLKQKLTTEKIPLKRINAPEDVAKVALFLASEDSKNITGQTIIIDGGATLI